MNTKSEISNILIVISKNVKRIRNDMKITQQELAYRCEMDKSTISNIECFNYSNITIGTLVKMSLALDCSIIEIMT